MEDGFIVEPITVEEARRRHDRAVELARTDERAGQLEACELWLDVLLWIGSGKSEDPAALARAAVAMAPDEPSPSAPPARPRFRIVK